VERRGTRWEWDYISGEDNLDETVVSLWYNGTISKPKK